MERWRWRNVPLPEAHLAVLAIGVILKFLLPWTLVPSRWIAHAVGWPLVLVGLTLAASAVRASSHVDVERPSEIVVGGPYGISRNPMYLGWHFLYVGIAFVLDTGWLLALLSGVLLLTHLVILREERHLERRFGDRYLRYKARVRRYL
jgi:protein-S-isoprenylcysteine O-methyltransferase Ste14